MPSSTSETECGAGLAIAALNRLSADRGERHFGGHAASVAGEADHCALAESAVAFARHLALVAAILAALRLIGETTFCVERLLVFAEHELLSAVSTVQILIIECVYEALIS